MDAGAAVASRDIKMADIRKTPQSPSYIPVSTPRASRSTLPSSLSVPQLGLVPTSRHPSVSGSPSHSTPPTSVPYTNGVHTPNASGLPSLRSLRSLLPFSSAKPGSQGSSPSTFHSPFSGFGASRRSMTVERKSSGSFFREAEEDKTPVISIEASPQRRPADGSDDTHSAAAPRPSPQPSESISETDQGPPKITYTPDPPLSSELSTILESDLSGMSKHLPAFDDSRDSIMVQTPDKDEKEDDGRSSDFQAFLIPPERAKSSSSPDLHDTSVLDLSTTHLTDEVLHALKQKTSGGNWLDVSVVQDAPDSRPPSAQDNNEEGTRGRRSHEPESSFHLDSLDPDLAALLSPNRMAGTQPGLRIPAGLPAPSTTPPPTGNSSLPSCLLPPSQLITPQSTISTLPPSPMGNSPMSGSESVASQSSTARTSITLSRSSLGRGTSSSIVPRLMRSATDRATQFRSDRVLGTTTTSRAASDPTLPLDEGRRASMDSVYMRRPAPPSPLSAEPAPQPLQQPANIETGRRPVTSRLNTTPARPALYNPAASRFMRSTAPSSSPSNWDGESVSPSSRAHSSMSAAPTTRRLHRARPSADEDLQRPSSSREQPTQHTRSRKRSFSVGEESPPKVAPASRPTAEWLGPRTAKAFAAAGLLDYDRDGSSSSSSITSGLGSRYASVRSMNDRDYRSQYAPSRAAFSEAGSAGSWRSGSVSRAMTFSEAASVHGGQLDSASTTPRTTISAGSTAPTSVSGASSPQHVQASLQTLHDKHALETGTLLAALADSQRTAQALRAENAQLTGRVQELEAQLANAHSQLRHQQYAPPLARSVLDRISRPASSEGLGRRFQPRAQGLGLSDDHSPQRPSSLLTDGSDEREREMSTVLLQDATYRTNRKRVSGADSIFALPPSNMSLLLQEDGVATDHSHPGSTRSTSPPSPRASARPLAAKHAPKPSISSVSNISPTTANFSMTDVAGSPRSLFLRPEHELHLGDMASLDLRFEEDEEDDGVGDGR